MIALHGVCIGRGSRPALDEINLSFKPGERCALIGPPEAGKSVLLKVIAGLIKPEAGSVHAYGTPLVYSDDLALARWQREVGMSFQNDALFDSMSVFENVAFPLRRRGVVDSEIETRVMKRLIDVGLGDASQKFPGDISGGMRKRVGIARATIAGPRVGLFDEPQTRPIDL